MAAKRKRIPRYSKVQINGHEYYKTDIEDADGKRVILYGKTREEVYDKEMAALEQIDNATFRRKSPTVAEYCEKWLLMQSVHIRATTLIDYTSKVRRHIIKELGEEHIKSGKPIIYTSADSVLQIAAHEEAFGLERLYDLCKLAFKLVQPYNIARVIARPFVGTCAADFTRTTNRHDYAVPAPQPTLLDKMVAAGGSVYAVGKIADIFAHRGITKHYAAGGLDKLVDATKQAVSDAPDNTIVFTNFVDFDSSYGHRRDIQGYGEALEYFDSRLPEITALLHPDDLLLMTADHGNDPSWSGTDHTREKIPVLFSGAGIECKQLKPMQTFADIGQTIADYMEIEPTITGTKADLF